MKCNAKVTKLLKPAFSSSKFNQLYDNSNKIFEQILLIMEEKLKKIKPFKIEEKKDKSFKTIEKNEENMSKNESFKNIAIEEETLLNFKKDRDEILIMDEKIINKNINQKEVTLIKKEFENEEAINSKEKEKVEKKNINLVLDNEPTKSPKLPQRISNPKFDIPEEKNDKLFGLRNVGNSCIF